jgi:hypothetical protein
MPMTLAEVVGGTIGALLGVFLLVVIAYATSRAASIAHFRTKLEYFRSVLKEGTHRGEK